MSIHTRIEYSEANDVSTLKLLAKGIKCSHQTETGLLKTMTRLYCYHQRHHHHFLSLVKSTPEDGVVVCETVITRNVKDYLKCYLIA